MKWIWDKLKNAAHGLKVLWVEEPIWGLELIIALGVIGLSLIAKLDFNEWAIIIITIGVVIFAETINSIIERLAEISHSDANDKKIGKIKDMSAGASLIMVIMSIVIAGLVIIPNMIEAFS